jgi:DNA-binding response OmpR family regulator
VTARILIVEDHPTMRGAMRLVLEEAGYGVSEAVDGHAALEAVGTEPPALVVMDLNLPGVTGSEVLTRLREEDATRTLPVIVVTATGEEGRTRVLELGADGYVTKPFSPGALLQTVEQVLQARGLREA